MQPAERGSRHGGHRDTLRSGAWLTRERIRLVASPCSSLRAAGISVPGRHRARSGRHAGPAARNRFLQRLCGRHLCARGQPEAPFDLALQHAREQRIFGEATPFYGWHYPPFFLFIAAALALMPYGAALAVWQAVTLGALSADDLGDLELSSPEGEDAARDEGQGMVAATIKCQAPPGQASTRPASHSKRVGTIVWLLLALAFPAVLVNIGHGQNGFLTAALLGGAWSMLDRRPIVAGILFGLLAYKPQYRPDDPAGAGGERPLALLRRCCGDGRAARARDHRRVRSRMYGTRSSSSTRFTRIVALEQGNTGWYKIQSVFCLGAHVGRDRSRSPTRCKARWRLRTRRRPGPALA